MAELRNLLQSEKSIMESAEKENKRIEEEEKIRVEKERQALEEKLEEEKRLNPVIKEVQFEKDLKGHTNSVRSANFSPDGKWIVTASWDNTAKLWESDGTFVATLEGKPNGHTKVVNSANFSPDGKGIVTASDDKTAKLWKIIYE
ncbi:MAG: hypothetical protein HQK52_08545 [Oligoflexia bacterium]|nr:hypothetical protein [Oligoflexia bacterium]